MTTLITREITACRACGDAALYEVFTLGPLRLSNAFPATLSELTALPKVPHTLVQCRACGLVQLTHTTDPQLLYGYGYWYRSGTNETMRAELADVVACARRWAGPLTVNDVVVDIGANDGTLLAQYAVAPEGTLPEAWCPIRVAIEPTAHQYPELPAVADHVAATLFPCPIPYTSLKVVTSIAMFYDVDDPRAFCHAVRDRLAPDGVWIVQLQDLAQMLQAGAWDNVVAEHLTYYSFWTFARLVTNCGLRILHVEPRGINGGSLRFVVARADHPQATLPYGAGCDEWARMELMNGVEAGMPAVGPTEAVWQFFRKRATDAVLQTDTFLRQVAQQGGIVDLYGASTKANTFLQVGGFGPLQFRQAWERQPQKVGRLTATGIPIVGEADGRHDPPTALLGGIWQFRDAILVREQAYVDAGGTLAFALPTLEVITGAGV